MKKNGNGLGFSGLDLLKIMTELEKDEDVEAFVNVLSKIKVAIHDKSSDAYKHLAELGTIDPLAGFRSALIRLNRTAMDEICSKPTIELLNFTKFLISHFVHNRQNKSLIPDIKTFSNQESYSLSSIDDMNNFMTLIEDYGEVIMGRASRSKSKSNFFLLLQLGESLMKLHASAIVLKEIASVKLKGLDHIDEETLGSFYKIGFFLSKIDNNTSKYITDPKLRSALKQALGSVNIKKRWDPHELLKQDAIEFADKLWSEGDKRFHNRMALNIFNTRTKKDPRYNEIKDQLLPRKIKTKIKELAAKEAVNAKGSEDDETIELTAAEIEKMEAQEKEDRKDIEKARKAVDGQLLRAIRNAIKPTAKKYNLLLGVEGVKKKADNV